MAGYIDSFKDMSDEDIYRLSQEKDKYGSYTHNANLAYMERQRRKGVDGYIGHAPRPSKYSADWYYYGGVGY